jgi:hypothetical protein
MITKRLKLSKFLAFQNNIPSANPAMEINKLVKLQLFTCCGTCEHQLITNEFLSALRLPDLRRLDCTFEGFYEVHTLLTYNLTESNHVPNVLSGRRRELLCTVGNKSLGTQRLNGQLPKTFPNSQE